MNDQQRKMFINVVNAGSFSKAAQLAFISPQSVSQQMRHLEEEVGVPLLERGAQGVTLTEAGHTFYRGCLELEKATGDLVEQCREAGTPPHTVITIGSNRDHTLNFLPLFLPEFLRRYPSMSVRYADVHHSQMLDELRNGIYDVTESINHHQEDIGFTLIRREGRSCAVAANNPLARKTVVEPEDLIGQRVYVFSLEWAADLKEYLQVRCPQVQLLESGPASLFRPQDLYETGDAVYLLPNHMRDRSEPLVPVPFDVDITCEYGFEYLATNEKWLEGFLSCAVESLA